MEGVSRRFVCWAAMAALLSATHAHAASHPCVFSSPSDVAAIKLKVAAHEEPWYSARTYTVSRADTYLGKTPESVVDNGGGLTGDPHLFVTDSGHRDDYLKAMRMGQACTYLGLAYAFAGNTAYADKLIQLANAWCLDPATCMKPLCFNFGPHVAGLPAGSATEIYAPVSGIIHGADLVWDYAGWAPDKRAQFAQWVRDLCLDAAGRSEATDYRATWREVLVAAGGALLDDPVLMNVAFAEFKQLLPGQVEAQGRLAYRFSTNSLSISLYGIDAMTMVAEIARRHGEDLYTYTPDGNRSLKLVYDFHALFARNSISTWVNAGHGPQSEQLTAVMNAFWELPYSRFQSDAYGAVVTQWGRPMDEIRVLGCTTLSHGELWRLTAPTNAPPVAKAKNARVSLGAGLAARVVVADVDDGSYDPDGASDVEAITISSPDDTDTDPFTVTLGATGDYPVTLSIRDRSGASDSATCTVTVTGTIVETAAAFQDGVLPSADYAGTCDTVISESAAAASYGSVTSLTVDGDYPTGASLDLFALVKWDISSIPPGCRVVSAELGLNVTNSTTQSYGIHAMNRAWSETEATWLLASAEVPWQMPGAAGPADRGGDLLGTAACGGLGWQSIALNELGVALVQSWIEWPESNHGIVIADTVSFDGLAFSSREAAKAALRPKLVIVYHSADGNGTPVVSAGDDITLTLPQNSTPLEGTATDDGLPDPPGKLTISWTTVSGPGDVAFADASAAATAATFSAAGSYVLRLTASDGERESSDDVSVAVLEPAAGGWTALNDCVYDAGTAGHVLAPNVTTYDIGTNHPHASAGVLIDIASGAATPVSASLSESGGVSWQPEIIYGGGECAAGTDAAATFAGIDMHGILTYGDPGWWVEIAFTGLDPAKRYEFAATANRNGAYPARTTLYTLVGAASCTNASTAGATVVSETAVSFCTGWNTDAGCVARWTDIAAPGGTFSVRITAADGAEAGYKAYPLSAFMLKELTAPHFPPQPIEGDANLDCRVNILDLLFVRERLNADIASGDNRRADVNRDGRVNVLDLIFIRNRLGAQCP